MFHFKRPFALDKRWVGHYFSAMIASEPKAEPAKRGARYSYLENGTHLTAGEFMRRYEASPEVKKAELINGIVYMASRVRLDLHGEPDGLIQTWLGNYSIATVGVRHATNSTIRLGPDDVPQPDGLLRILPECGGHAQEFSGYLQSAPELVVEVAASTSSIDAREKLTAYRRAGVREYVLWRTEDEEVDWWVLEEDDYQPLTAGTDGILRSKVLPGLWLDVRALLARDGAKVMQALQAGLKSTEHAAFFNKLSEESHRR